MKRIALLLAILMVLAPLSVLAEPQAAEIYIAADEETFETGGVRDPLLSDYGVAPEDRHEPTDGEPGAAASAAADWSYIRAHLSTNHSQVEVTFHGNYSVRDGSGNPVMLVTDGASYTLRTSGSGVALVSASGSTVLTSVSISVVQHTPPAGMPYNYFTLYNTRYGGNINYRGSLTAKNATVNGSAGLQLINRVHIEQYLAGVIGYEMGDNQPTEALRAQAILSRNFAVSQLSPSRIYDVYDYSLSQVYRGIPSSHPNSAEAVAATAGQVVYKNGSRINTYYSASNGGVTSTAKERWSSTAVWHETVKADPYDLAWIERDFQRTGSTDFLERVAIPKSGGSGSTVAALVTKSLLPALQKTDPAVTAERIAVTGIAITDAKKYPEMPESYFTALNVTFSYTLDGVPQSDVPTMIPYTDFYVANGYGYFENGSLSQYWLSEDAGSYYIRHARYGHAVGVSQVGAREMAGNHSMNAAAIIAFYYEGASVAEGSITAETLTPMPELSTYTLVTAVSAPLYATASVAARVLEAVPGGTAVTVTGESGDFYAVTVSGQAGYMQKAAFTVVYEYVRIVNVSESCNVRSGPGTAYAKIGSAPKDAIYPLLEADAEVGWHKINFSAAYPEAYVSTQYAQAITAEEAGVVQPGPYTLTLAPPAGYTKNEVWVDGVCYTAAAADGAVSVTLAERTAQSAIMYKYNENDIPVGMSVWTLTYANGAGYVAALQTGLTDLLSYNGFSIRVTGAAGIRCKTGISTALRRSLLSPSGVNGWRLTEYGTVVMRKTHYDAGSALVLGGQNTASGKSYWTENGRIKDMVFETVAGRYRYTSVLTNIAQADYDTLYSFRGYIKLQKGDRQMTLYGPVVSRSIVYIAQQIMDAGEFAPGTAAYDFVASIISYVNSR